MKRLLSSDTKRNVQNIPHCVTFGQILLLERQNTLAEQQAKGETLVKSWQTILSYCGCMPIKARIDAPGAIHHIILRGIERKSIFKDDVGCKHITERLGRILNKTSVACYSWVLIADQDEGSR